MNSTAANPNKLSKAAFLKNKILFIESDTELQEYEKTTTEDGLYMTETGKSKFTDLSKLDITFQFDAFCNGIETYEKFKQFDNILLCTSFTGNSEMMLENFMYLCKRDNLQNKIIVNTFAPSVWNSNVRFLFSELKRLDAEQNISLYVTSDDDFNHFVKFDLSLL